jgi:hypothetical protein
MITTHELLVDARAFLLGELELAERAAKLPFLVAQVVVVAIEALFAAWTNYPEDACQGCLL